ncbi:DUF2971 domain-containing protein [Vibrio cyclitrophicus]|uniref:DUF2971 domain-containing protein n=1 Tax=Vibrio cyclitrophicus TaxID=47951 RepID=UPI000C8153F2|nr:DUF2971 domain-containing protein [Vibrio cyclitrophicus]PME11290.1 hypothetical protein BCV43_20445 [Vibrio cyclitrophicus]
MLNSLFKYTTFRPDTFEDLLFRGTQKYALNDPFELTPGSGEHPPSLNPEVAYFDYSVFSLSETNNNLLMWAHYANEHKGIVIEFDTSRRIFSREYYKNQRVLRFIDDVSSSEYEHFPNEPMYIQGFDEEVVIDLEATNNYRLVSPGTQHRVLYNPDRPDFAKYNNRLDHFMVKSDAWIYEKEHRIILPLTDVDKLVIAPKHEQLITDSFWLHGDLEKKRQGNSLHISNPQDVIINELMESTRGAYIHMYRNKFEQFNEICELLKYTRYSTFLFELSKDSSSIFLYKANPGAIKGVYMGCRMLEEDKIKLKEILENNPMFRHVELYESKASKTRFELDFNPVLSNRNANLLGPQPDLFS